MEEDRVSEIMNDIELISQKTSFYNDWKIVEKFVTPPFPIPDKMCIGIDPGTTHIGLCTLYLGSVRTFQVTFPRDKNPILRMVNAENVLSYLINYQDYKPKVCIEGASYGDIYRQVELAEVRTACVFWALHHKMNVIFAQPTEIRKKVFGNGTIKGKDVWKNVLSGDAGDALACAYFAGMS